MNQHTLPRSPLLAAAAALALVGGLVVSAAPAQADDSQPDQPAAVAAPAEADPNPPIVRNTTPVDGAVYAAGTQITVAFECFDPDDPITYCGQYSHALGEVVTLEPGNYHWRFYANNARANVIHNVFFTVLPYDVTPPVLTVTAPPLQSSGWYRGHPQYLFDATDDSGAIRSVVLEYADGSQTVTAGSTQSKIFFEDGVHVVQAFAIDAAGNTSAPVTVTVPVDTTAPVVTLSPSADQHQLEVGDPLLVDVACVDATSGVAGCPPERTLDTSAPGTFTVDFEATDIAGHRVVVPFSYTVLPPDVEAPVLSLRATAPNAHGWYASPLEAELTADDGTGRGVDSIQWSLTGPNPSSGTSGAAQWIMFAGDGVHTLTASAVDRLGNRSEPESYTVRIDVTAPVIDASTRLSFVQGSTPDFSGLCSDATSFVVDCDLVDPITVAAAPGVTETLGEHTAIVQAEDAAGNLASAEIVYDVVAAPKGAAEPATLAITGSQGGTLGALFAAMLLVLGAGGVIVARRLS